MTTRLIRRHEVQELTGLSRSAIYDQMERGEFPRPVRVGRRAVAWKMSDIEAWFNSRQSA